MAELRSLFPEPWLTAYVTCRNIEVPNKQYSFFNKRFLWLQTWLWNRDDPTPALTWEAIEKFAELIADGLPDQLDSEKEEKTFNLLLKYITMK